MFRSEGGRMKPVTTSHFASILSRRSLQKPHKRLVYALLGIVLLFTVCLLASGTAVAGNPVVSLPGSGPIAVDTALTPTGHFTDPDSADTHTATWQWGDGTTPTPGMVTEPGVATPGEVTGTHVYGRPGIYTVTLKIADAGGGGTGETTASVAVTVLGVALYSQADASLTGTSKVESPLVSGKPSAATLVNGKLTKTGSADLSRTVLFVKANGATVPALGTFMPDALVSSLMAASQAAQRAGTVYRNLSYSGKQGASFTSPITVDGNLTISGSGTYSFNSVYVTGNVSISDSATVTCASLRVGGTLAVSGKAVNRWGPTYVAGDVIFSGSGPWSGSLLVTGGNVTLSGSSSLGGDGKAGAPKPVRILLVGEAKRATLTGSVALYGVLYNQFGGLSQSGSSSITGCALLGGSYSASGTSKLVYALGIIDSLTPRFTVTFDSNGGQDVAPMQVYQGQALGALPVPNKPDSIFLGWYTDEGSFENAVSEQTTALSDLALHARYVIVGGTPELEQATSVGAEGRSPDFAIRVVSSATGTTAGAVKAALQLEVVDGTPFAGISVSAAGGGFTVAAAEGYTPGSSYRLTLTDPALTFEGQPASVRSYCFTIAASPVMNLQLDAGVIQIVADDIDDVTIDGVPTDTLSLPLATTEEGVNDSSDTGTFTYTGTEPLHIGDIVAIYNGTPPEDRDPTTDYSDEAVAYVEVTAIDGTTITYRSPQAKDVLFTPDVLPVHPEDDTDGIADNHSITIAVSKMTYTTPELAAIGLTPETVVEKGDFLAFGTGTDETDAEVTFAKIVSVQSSGDDYIIAYADVTEDELNQAMDLYSSQNQGYEQVVEGMNVPAMEKAIEQQAVESGFAAAAAGYLKDLALQTDGFKSQPNAMAPLAAAGDESASPISNLDVDATIDTTLEHFPGLRGLDCGIVVSFDVACGEDMNIHVSATFEEELRVTLNADGGAVWKTKKVWIFRIPYIADYRMTGNIDLYNYTGIDVRATLTTSAGDSSPLDIAQQIKDLMTAPTYQSEQISAGTQAFYELYSEMLANEHGYVELFKQQIAHTETAIDPFHILVAGMTLEFVVSADVNLSLGAQFDYQKGTRYVFTLLLFSKTATSDKIDLVPETYNFQFYVMGTIGLRAGIVARVELGLFSLNLDSIGLEVETGPYVRLWGYFFYELHHANSVTTSKTSGALYLELGIYLETRFLAQALNGQYSYNPTLYEHEWPLWTAGSRYNIFDFSYNLTDATDDIRLKGATKTFALPASVFNMKRLDLTEGDVTSTAHTSSEFTITFTNSNFSQTNGTIAVVSPVNQHITEGYMTVRWNGAPLSFTSVPISRTYHVVWDDLASSYTLSLNSQGGSAVSPIVGAYGSAVTLPMPTRTGYSFGGWYLNAAGTGTAYTATTMPATNMTLHAKWTANTNTAYTVRHLQQAVAGSYGLFATQNFTGTTDSQITPAVNIYAGFTAPATQTVTIVGGGTTAVEYRYQRNSYQLTFKPANGASDVVRTVLYGGQIAPPAVARAGYAFGGWYRDAGCTTAFTATTMPATNVVLYAKWTANSNTPYAVKHYQQTLAGSSYDLAATQNFTGTTDSQVTPSVNTYTGFTAPVTQTVAIGGGGTTVVSYYYTRNSYQMTFVLNNGQSDIPNTIKYGGSIVTPTVTRTGYTFAGWYRDAGYATLFTATTMPAGNLTAYAKWTADAGTAYTVTHYREIVAGYYYSLFETETLYGASGSPVTPPVKSYEGFTAPSTQTVTISGDGGTVVRYDYRRNSYEIVFHPNNGEPDIIPTPLRYGRTIVTPPVSRSGFAFDGWYYDADLTLPYTATTMPAHDVQLYAAWRLAAVVIFPVTITSELSSGEGATLPATAWVHDTVTLTWDQPGNVPTGSIRVTGTMPDGHTWVVWTEPIPATATSPFTFTTTDQGLGTGQTWEGGVLGLGLYQFSAEYVPDEASLFHGATSDIELVTVVQG